jgi:hypothetical protein
MGVAGILTGRVRLEVESIDRIYLNVYVQQLQYTGGAASFFQAHGVRRSRRRR